MFIDPGDLSRSLKIVQVIKTRSFWQLIQKFSHLDLTMPMHGCGSYDSRTLILEGGLKLKDANTKVGDMVMVVAMMMTMKTTTTTMMVLME